MIRNLTIKEQDFLKLKGFVQNDKNSGFYYLEDDGKTKVLIAYDDETFKIEFYEFCDDGDGNLYEDYDKVYSKDEQSLEQFIEEWV